MKHCFLAIWWLFRVEIWIFYYWCIGRWLLGLSLYFPRYNDIWYKKKPKYHGKPSSGGNTSKNSAHTSNTKQKTVISKEEEPIIPRIQGNTVIVGNSRCSELYRFTPSFGGGAAFVDAHPRNNRMLVTTQDGRVGVYEKSCQMQIFSIRDVETARWSGDEVLVKHRNGKTILYTKTGGWIREFQ